MKGVEPILEVRDLRVQYPTRRGLFTAVDDVSFDVHPGEVLGLVGESGAGKSTIGSAITQLLDFPGHIAAGSIRLRGEGELVGRPEDAMRRIRGRRIGTIFQDPLTALCPVLSVQTQLLRAIGLNTDLRGAAALRRAVELMAEVGIPEPASRIRQYPHQFSGGMRQRVVIAIALAGNPELLIADEPTTALDVSVQAEILDLLTRLGAEHRAGIILVTHDMAVINQIADRVAVMRHGRICEIGTRRQIIDAPRHGYVRALIDAVPRTDRRIERFRQVEDEEANDARAPHNADSNVGWFKTGADRSDNPTMVELDCVAVVFEKRAALLPRNRRYLRAVDGVTLSIRCGESFGLLGESGSGKSTLARAICGLQAVDEGTIRIDGDDITGMANDPALRRRHLNMQMIFQDPFSSLTPRLRVGELIAEPLRVHRIASADAIPSIVRDLLERVGLKADDADKLPHQFSGGQRQRICIARALAMRPRFLICDEPTSALDVSVQAQILNLLKDLQRELGLTILFISHNLAVVRQMCDRVAVMKEGRLCEVAEVEALFESPQHDYSKRLIELMPKFTSAVSA